MRKVELEIKKTVEKSNTRRARPNFTYTCRRLFESKMKEIHIVQSCLSQWEMKWDVVEVEWRRSEMKKKIVKSRAGDLKHSLWAHAVSSLSLSLSCVCAFAEQTLSPNHVITNRLDWRVFNNFSLFTFIFDDQSMMWMWLMLRLKVLI